MNIKKLLASSLLCGSLVGGMAGISSAADMDMGTKANMGMNMHMSHHTETMASTLDDDDVAITLNLNGVNMPASMMSHLMPDGRAYTSVKDFAAYYGVSYNWDAATKMLTLDGKTVPATTDEVHDHGDMLMAPVRAMIATLGDADAQGNGHFAIGYDQDTHTVNAALLPKGVVPLEGHAIVPKMGEYWADPAKLPIGPLFGIYKGKLVFYEVMPDKDLNKDVRLSGSEVPLPNKVDHTDINWHPNGHPGDLKPHYDIHMYFISVAEQDQIK